MGQLINFCAGTNAQILPAKMVNAILKNVPYDGIDDKSIADTNLTFDYARTEHKFLDTGGYQYAVAEDKGKKLILDSKQPGICSDTELNLTLEHVIYAMVNMDITMANAMDFPINEIGTKEQNHFEYMKKSGINVEWAKESLRLRDEFCPDVELFLPIQCYDLKQLNHFLNLLGPIKFDGYSIPTRNFGVKELAVFLLRFYQLKIKKVHILGTSEFFTIALAAYMTRHFFEWVSLDATTWRESAQSANYLNQHDLKPEKIHNVFMTEDIKNSCECPFCKDTTFTFIKNLPQTDRIDLLRCHNFWVIDQAAKDLYDNADTILTLERYLKRKSANIEKIDELINVLSLIDLLKDEDIKQVETLLS
jgi:tRNA-guanine family transglycosylase